MRSLSEFSIKRPVTAFMIIVTMTVAGLISIFSMSTALLPDFDIPVVMVTTTWIGASPEDVDKLVTKEIEDAVTKVKGVDKISSYSSQDVSTVVVEFKFGNDNDLKQRELQTEIDKIINELPEDADKPILIKIEPGASSVISYYLSGRDLIELYEIADLKIKPNLEKIEGVGEIDISGGIEEEILVEIDPEKLKSFKLDVNTISSLISQSNINIPSGNIKYGSKDFLVRINGELETLAQVKDIVVQNRDGNVLRLKDIANISVSEKDRDSYARKDGKPALSINVTKSKGGNSVFIAGKVRSEIEKLKASALKGTDISLTYDESVEINRSISTVKDNAITGLVLASIVLLIFLKNVRATAIIAISIPVSVIFTFFLLLAKGINLNLLSLMGLALGVGMLVDNSIVVLDNIYRHMTELKKPKFQAARDGASEMAIPILASTATTVAVFLPMVLKEGLAKEIFHDLSFSISFALLSSLLVALIFVPMAASKLLKEDIKIDSDGIVMKFVKSIYDKFLRAALNHRIKTILITIALLVMSVVLFGKYGKGGFFPRQDQSRYTVVGTPANGLEIDKIDKIAKEIEEIVKDDKYTVSYSTTVQSNGIAVVVETPKIKERKNGESIKEISDYIRPKFKNIKDVDIEVKDQQARGPQNANIGVIDIQLLGDDFDELKRINSELLEIIKAEKEFVDVQSTYTGGNPQAKLQIDRTKAQYYGLRVSQIALFVSYQIRGDDAVTIKTGSKEIDVTVRLKEGRRNSIDDLLNLDIATPSGETVKIKEIASVEIVEGPSQIQKMNKAKKISIGMNLDGIDLGGAAKRLEEIAKEYGIPKTVEYKIGGEAEDSNEVFGDLFFALAIGIFLIYFILASQFESFGMPVMIMFSVPLSVMGVFFGLLITGTQMDIMVMVGIIMLAGIVVNNAIVLIDYIKLLMARGQNPKEAIINAGEARLRPIIMTTMTTVFGMVPLAIARGEGTEFYRGMSVAVIFGLSLSTLLTLIVIPVIVSLMESVKAKLRRKSKEEKNADISDEVIEEIVGK
jgi:HAE1 family hydrophobic/amphiphilic exporter-1